MSDMHEFEADFDQFPTTAKDADNPIRELLSITNVGGKLIEAYRLDDGTVTTVSHLEMSDGTTAVTVEDAIALLGDKDRTDLDKED